MVELGLLAWLSALYGGVAIPTVFTMSRVQGWRGRRRNKKGLCAQCSTTLYEGGVAASRIGGVLHCPRCTAAVRRDMTVSMCLVTGMALLLPVIGGLGMAGVLPFISGGVTAGAIAGLLVPPLVLGGALGFEMRRMKRANESATLPEGEVVPELNSGPA
jgi:hypothetical protein